MTTTVKHDDSAQRYEIRVDDAVAGFTQTIDRGDYVEMPHTVIDEEYSGQGLAGRLVGEALDDLRAQGRTVKPTCSYVRKFIDEHPQYADLVA